MFDRSRRKPNPNFVSLIIATVLLVITFTMIGFVILSVVVENNFRTNNQTSTERPRPDFELESSNTLLGGTPNPLGMSIFRDTALGFELTYPQAWQKKQKGLTIIFSPSTTGLDPDNLQDAAIWFGIPPDNEADEKQLLTQLQATLAYDNQILDSSRLMIGDQVWQSIRLNFIHESLKSPATAIIATTSRDGVGYYVVAVAPANTWTSLEPGFQSILDSFRFTSQAVLRPTDATPPPTPTPTPTPVTYLVQSGDTFGQIALEFEVEVEALMARNGYDDARVLRTGAKLVIPIKRR